MAAVPTVPVLLSGSSQGQPILVAATSTPGTAVHSTGTSSTVFDEIWLYAQNTDTTDRKLTIEWGGVTSPNHLVEMTIPAESGLRLVVPGLRLTGTGSVATAVKAFCATGNVVTIIGNVNRLTVS
jgi:hypothetical protein